MELGVFFPTLLVLQCTVIPKLDPEYLQFHNQHLQYITPPHTLPWDYDLSNTKFRSFTLEGTAPRIAGSDILSWW
jgi:hypothetical protein